MNTAITIARSIHPRFYSSILVVVLLSLVALYMYFVGMSVVHVVMSKDAAQQIALIKSDISELESAYIDAQHTIRAELALQEGFISQPEKTFIAVGDTSVVVSRDE